MSAEFAAAKIEAKHRAEEAAAVARKLEDVRHRKHRFMQFGISLRDANMVYGSTISEILTKC
ncbi:hypothetical protein Tdes44962_MAKER00424 [Teratosphaeria destructans]|uniref:Uncharacterized protein n=1 Tax=Teratosphaeria destructans TaxID=418781 RepID=A0A9W7SST9_9PEZI|nr:hypothetical protein Tdes44962_MAKER00424 [Teratosphaeria destructans]